MDYNFMFFVAVIWFIISIIMGYIGEKRRIGFIGAALISLLFSPVISLIVIMLSPTKADLARKEEEMKLLKKIAEK